MNFWDTFHTPLPPPPTPGEIVLVLVVFCDQQLIESFKDSIINIKLSLQIFKQKSENRQQLYQLFPVWDLL